jgi:hypothetical protein
MVVHVTAFFISISLSRARYLHVGIHLNIHTIQLYVFQHVYYRVFLHCDVLLLLLLAAAASYIVAVALLNPSIFN